MAISDSKDYCAYPDLIFYYAAPSANHLYANPRMTGVRIVDRVLISRSQHRRSLCTATQREPPEISG
jgi:hypothetical protein